MARVEPFDAVHYNIARYGRDVTRFVAPPYDVIDRRLERKLKDDRLNITHITLGDEGDSYRTAAKRLRRWLNDQVLVRDRDESFYVYEQSFIAPDGKPRARSGIVGMVRLEEFSRGVVLPHEKTMPKHSADRSALLSAVRGHTEQVFMLYDDPSNTIESRLLEWRKREEVLRFVDPDAVHHRLIKISGRRETDEVRAVLAPLNLLIADGHHRYETSLEYSRRMRAREGSMGGDKPYDFVLADLISSGNPGLVLYPVHRLVSGVGAERLGKLRPSLERDFELEDFSDEDELARAVERPKDESVGLWIPSLKVYSLARPRRQSEDPLKRLSVWLAQERVLKKAMGFTQEMLDAKENIDYAKGTAVARSIMAEGEHDACVLVRCPTVSQVFAVARTGRLMPQKSTYFYPKIWSGAVMRLF